MPRPQRCLPLLLGSPWAVLSCAGCAERTCDRNVDTWAIAMTLFYRFYARKSMKKNNTFVSWRAGAGGVGWSRVHAAMLAGLAGLASQHGWRPELLPPPTAAGSAAVTPRSASPASPATPCSPQIVAAACLFLAGKINDKPRHHSKVANLLLARWYGKDNPQLQRLAAGAPTQDAAAVRHLPPAQVAEARAFWENM